MHRKINELLEPPKSRLQDLAAPLIVPSLHNLQSSDSSSDLPSEIPNEISSDTEEEFVEPNQNKAQLSSTLLGQPECGTTLDEMLDPCGANNEDGCSPKRVAKEIGRVFCLLYCFFKPCQAAYRANQAMKAESPRYQQMT